MKKRLFSTRKLVYIAVLSALAIAMTIVIPIPIGNNGYVNIGDSVIFLAAYILGPIGGLIVGAMTFLADIILGYAFYAPATLIIKGIEGLVLGLGFVLLKKIKNRVVEMVLALFVIMFAGCLMMLGYFFADIILLNNVAAAAIGIVPNTIQASISTGISFVLIYVINIPKLIPASKNTTRNNDDNESFEVIENKTEDGTDITKTITEVNNENSKTVIDENTKDIKH
ncbi:MAG: ECF transporter S component [Clostridia bacterium]